jgi:hypothetical protein
VQNRTDFATFVQCDVQNPDSSCNGAVATAPGSYGLLALGNGNGNGNANQQVRRLCNALQDAEGPPHLIPVYDGYSGAFQVVGWAVGTFSGVSRNNGNTNCNANGNGQTVHLTVTFQTMIVDGTSLASGTGPKPTDFGVRAIALTG